MHQISLLWAMAYPPGARCFVGAGNMVRPWRQVRKTPKKPMTHWTLELSQRPGNTIAIWLRPARHCIAMGRWRLTRRSSWKDGGR